MYSSMSEIDAVVTMLYLPCGEHFSHRVAEILSLDDGVGLRAEAAL
jgi:hypothetical protein